MMDHARASRTTVLMPRNVADLQCLFQAHVLERRVALPRLAQPVDFAPLDAEVVDLGLERHHRADRRRVERVFDEADVDRAAVFDPRRRERPVAGDRRDLGGGAHERRDLEAQRLVQPRLDLLRDRGRIAAAGRENHVAAGDEGLHAGESQPLEFLAQPRHRHGMAADVDGAEKGDKALADRTPHSDGRMLTSPAEEPP
jgi:hypothetical protein